MELKYYTIFGERNSGTNYLKSVLDKKLNLKYTNKFGFKHWYIKNHHPRGRENETTDNECLEDIENNEDTLFIFTVRNAYDWCGSMKQKPYHIRSDKSNMFNFISKKYIAYQESLPPEHSKNSKSPWYVDKITNTYFIEEAVNLIQLRNTKNEHFYNLKNKVKYFSLIKQESLLDDINKMISDLNLSCNSTDILNNYRKPINYKLDEQSKEFINKNLNNYIDNNFYNL
jgi:hypothetical protein